MSKKDEIIIEKNKDSKSISIDKDKIEVKKTGNLVIGTVNLALDPLRKRNDLYYKKNIWYLVVDIILLLLIASMGIFIFFNNRLSPAKKVDLSLSLKPEIIIAGDLETIELSYFTHLDAKNTALQVFLPDNFIIDSVQPSNLFNYDKKIFNLGDLNSQTNGKVKITGFVWGEKDERQKISFNFSCSLCGRSGVSTAWFYDIEKTALDLDLEIPDQVYTNSEYEAKFKLRNNTNSDLKNISLDLGPEINIHRSDLNWSNNKTKIDLLPAGEERSFSLWAFAGEEGDFKIESKLDFNLGEHRFSSDLGGENLAIKNPPLVLNISNDGRNVSEQEKISYLLKYENQGKESIKDIKINLKSINPNFVIKNVELRNNPNNLKFTNNTLLIEDLVSGEADSLELEISFLKLQFSPQQSLGLQADLEYEINNQIIEHRLSSSRNKVRSSFSTLASAYYYSPQGDQLGVGPLPPAVGLATNYWIFLEFNLNGNELSNFSLSAELPRNVNFSNNSRALDGHLIFGEIGKRVVWEIEKINPGSGKYRANFEVTLIPGEADLGKVMTLLEGIKFQARDEFLNEEIVGYLKDINTNLEKDRLASGQGQVVNIK